MASTVSNASSFSKSWAQRRVGSFRLGTTLVVASMLVAFLALAFSRSYISHHELDVNDAGRMSTCESQVLNTIAPSTKAIDLSVLNSIQFVCYREVAEEDLLADFGIRKSAYLNQQLQTAILMWMVVAITLSGVALAGVQLVAGYKLAASGKAAFDQGGALSIEQSKISMKSSVTGLMILAISLAFFTVFVYKVYFIKDPGDAPVTGSGLPAAVAQPNPPAPAIPGAAYGSQPTPNLQLPNPGFPAGIGQAPSSGMGAQPTQAVSGLPNRSANPASYARVQSSATAVLGHSPMGVSNGTQTVRSQSADPSKRQNH